jgi:general secretion pathway protein I
MKHKTETSPFDQTGPFPSDAGFTLMEVLVSMAIIAVALTAVYRLHSQTLAMGSATHFYTTAPLLAQQKMVELQSKPANELADDSGDFAELYSGYHWAATINDVDSELLERTKESLKRIDLTVSSDGDRQTFSLRRYLLIEE